MLTYPQIQLLMKLDYWAGQVVVDVMGTNVRVPSGTLTRALMTEHQRRMEQEAVHVDGNGNEICSMDC